MLPLQNDEWTIDDIMALPEGERVELINGVPYDMASPTLLHQDIVGDLYAVIKDHIRDKKLPCKVVISPFGVFLSNDRDFVEPDLFVVCDKKKLCNDGCYGAPDWIIEVVSPSTKMKDCIIKQNLYCNNGVRLYWIVNPLTNLITVYDYENNTCDTYGKQDTIPVSICPGFSISFGSLESFEQ